MKKSIIINFDLGVFVRNVFGHFQPFLDNYRDKRSQIETKFSTKFGMIFKI